MRFWAAIRAITPEPVSLEPARREDIPDLLNLINALADYEHLPATTTQKKFEITFFFHPLQNRGEPPHQHLPKV